MTRSACSTITLSDVSTNDDERELRRVRQLQGIDPALVAALIAGGIFSNTDTLDGGAIEHIAETTSDAKHLYDRIKAYEQKLEATGINIPLPVLDAKDDHSESGLSDVAFSLAMAYGDSGYLLGIAVGMALGSGQPFAHVQRVATKRRKSR